MSGSSITESKDCCKSISKNIGSIICSTIENLSKIEIDCGNVSYNFTRASNLDTKSFNIIFIPKISSLSNFKLKSLKNGELSLSAI